MDRIEQEIKPLDCQQFTGKGFRLLGCDGHECAFSPQGTHGVRYTGVRPARGHSGFPVAPAVLGDHVLQAVRGHRSDSGEGILQRRSHHAVQLSGWRDGESRCSESCRNASGNAAGRVHQRSIQVEEDQEP